MSFLLESSTLSFAITIPVLFDSAHDSWVAFKSELIKLLREGSPLPRGASLSRTVGTGTLSFSANAFSILEDAIVISGIPSLKIKPPSVPTGYRACNLVIREKIDDFKIELKARKQKSKQRRNRTGGARIHGDAAIFITQKVRGRTVSGGLPSLGKRK